VRLNHASRADDRRGDAAAAGSLVLRADFRLPSALVDQPLADLFSAARQTSRVLSTGALKASRKYFFVPGKKARPGRNKKVA
jgi:hypothetical protein